ncbi:MAG TPA: FtsX-like permease family protein [Jiangellaceae bacterium]
MLLTATLTALVAAVLLVSATVLAPGVAESALQRTLHNADVDDTTLTASTGLDDEWSQLNQGVRAAVDARPGLIDQVTATMWSTAYTATGLGADDRLAIASFGGAERWAEPVEGRLPEPGAAVTEAAMHAAALEAAGIVVGDTLTVTPLTGSAPPTQVTVVGSYLPLAPDDPIWRGNGSGFGGAEQSDLRVVGPLLFDDADLLGTIAPTTATAGWRLPLAVDDVRLDTAPTVGDDLAALSTEIGDLRAGERGQQMAVSGGTVELVDQAREAASAARALLLVIVVMLAVLGVWALAFTARLVATRRAPTTALLRARGADEGRVLRWSLAGTLGPAVAVALAAPPLAELALRPLRDQGALGGAVDTSALAGSGWAVSAVVALVWLVLMVAADRSAGRSMAGVAAAGARPRRAAAQRVGLDLLLVALGVLALQQLRRPPDTASEVVLVIAPSLVVLAGTVVLVRALPWVAGAVATIANARPGAAAMLGANETSRRSVRHVAACVLVVLAITVSVFAASTQSSWSRFSSDTVDLAEPADVRVRSATSDPDTAEQTAAALADLPGVDAVMPVTRSTYSEGDVSIAVVGIDPDLAATMRWDERSARGDISGALRSIADPGFSEPLPVLVTPAMADRLGLAVGDQATLALPGASAVFEVAGLVDAVPGSSEASAMLTNRTALALRLDREIPDEWWVATSDGDDPATAATAAEAAAALPAVGAVTTHAEAAQRSADDPSAAGVVAGLTAGLVFAAVFVLIGVVVHTVTSFQARVGEYAVVRAIGLGRRGIAGSVSVEQSVLLGFSTLAGLALGLLVAWLVVPHTVGGLAGLPEVPPLVLEVPWDVVAALAAAIIVLTAALIVIQTRMTRAIDVPGVLRAGEDT